MYPYFILTSLCALAASKLLQEDAISRNNSFKVPQSRSDTAQPRPTLPAKPMPTHSGGDSSLEPSDCQLLNEGYGPLPEEDTPDAFRSLKVLWDISATAAEPDGYSLALENADGSLEPGAGYLGMELLESYNTTRCAELCDDRPRCGSFNICQLDLEGTILLRC